MTPHTQKIREDKLVAARLVLGERFILHEVNFVKRKTPMRESFFDYHFPRAAAAFAKSSER